jgi:hypothetical protein
LVFDRPIRKKGETMSAVTTVLKFGALAGGAYLLLDQLGVFKAATPATRAWDELPDTAPVTPPGGTVIAAGNGQPTPAAAPYSPPPATTPAAATVAAEDSHENRLRAMTEEDFAGRLSVRLNADTWNWYRQQAAGREFSIEGIYDPADPERGPLMTAAEFWNRRRAAGLSGVVIAMSGRRSVR